MNDKSTINIRNLIVQALASVALLLLAGCDLHHSADGQSSLHYVQGSVSSLAGTLILGNYGGDVLVLNADGVFSFGSPMMQGQTFNVTVISQPQSQTCSIANGSGVVGVAATDRVQVTCASKDLSVGGVVSGLSGTVVLQNGASNLAISNNGPFTFTVDQGAAYNIVVLTQPASQTCSVNNGNGTADGAIINNVQVTCATNTRTVGGNVVGLSGTLGLKNNGSDLTSITSDQPFTFATPVAVGATYNVTISTQPAGQTCVVTNGSGVIAASNVANVQVTCATDVYSIKGSVSGLSGALVLQNNGSDDLLVSSDGAFVFLTPLAASLTYNVTVLTQPLSQTCTVTNGAGIVGASDVTNVAIVCAPNSTTLSLSVANVALSVSGLTEYGISGTPSSGLARDIVVTNVGIDVALNLNVTFPTWPVGTSAASTCGSNLPPAGSCTIRITPGATATSDGTNPCSTGTAPIPGAVEVSADNSNTVASNVVVLSYGCIYQGGYVYALDDSTPSTGSIGGKVLTTSDQADPTVGVIWSSNGNSGTVGDTAYDAIYGISETSTTSSPNPSGGQVTGQAACNGAVDGVCNTNNIHVYYQNSSPSAPVNSSYYAAGLCKQTIAGYSDWTLPAVCELGYGVAGCGTLSTPTIQNVQSNLTEFNNLDLVDGFYWSSTESSANPSNSAWLQFLATGGFASQVFVTKDELLGVRCSRALTP